MAATQTTCDGDYCSTESFENYGKTSITIDFVARTYGIATGAVSTPMRDIADSDDRPDDLVWVKFAVGDPGDTEHVWFTAKRVGTGYRMAAGSRSMADSDKGPLAGKPGLFAGHPPATITTGYSCAPAP